MVINTFYSCRKIIGREEDKLSLPFRHDVGEAMIMTYMSLCILVNICSTLETCIVR